METPSEIPKAVIRFLDATSEEWEKTRNKRNDLLSSMFHTYAPDEPELPQDAMKRLDEAEQTASR